MSLTFVHTILKLHLNFRSRDSLPRQLPSFSHLSLLLRHAELFRRHDNFQHRPSPLFDDAKSFATPAKVPNPLGRKLLNHDEQIFGRLHPHRSSQWDNFLPNVDLRLGGFLILQRLPQRNCSFWWRMRLHEGQDEHIFHPDVLRVLFMCGNRSHGELKCIN